MADSATDYSSAAGILKEMLGGFKSSLRDSLPPLYQKLKPSAKRVWGKDFKFSVQTEEPQGVGSTLNSTVAVPEAEPGEYIECMVPYTRMYGTLLYDDMLLEAAGNSKEGERAFVDYTRTEMKGIKSKMAKEISRQAWGSKTGVICPCGVTAGLVILQLATTAQMRHFSKKGHIDIITTATGIAITNGSNRVIQSVDKTNKRLTLDAAGGVVTTDATMSVTRKGGYNAEMTGLADILSASANIYGITTASYPRWTPMVVAAVGAFDIKKVIQAAIDNEADMGGDPTLIVSNVDLQGQYWYQCTGSRSFDKGSSPLPPKQMGEGFYELYVIINGKAVPWISDPDCPAGELKMLCMDDLELGHIAEPDFIKVGGSPLLSNVVGSAGTPTWKAVIKYYPQMICTKRNSHISMTGITDIAGWR